jgi:hypothetical protein
MTPREEQRLGVILFFGMVLVWIALIVVTRGARVVR